MPIVSINKHAGASETTKGESVRPRVLIVARYAAQRAELYATLERGNTATPVAAVGSSVELASILGVARPDVIVFDEDSHDRSGLFAIASSERIGVVVLADIADIRSIVGGSTGNGFAILLRDATETEISAAVVAAAAHLTVFDDRVASSLAPSLTAAPIHVAAPAGSALSPREHEVLELIARGLPNKQIAVRLGISTHTVKFHIASLLVKLGAASRAEAVTLGARRGELLL